MSQKLHMICALHQKKEHFWILPTVFSSSHVSYAKNRDDISIHVAYTLYHVREIKSRTVGMTGVGILEVDRYVDPESILWK